MFTLNFEAYSIEMPLFQQKSNIAFMMLQAAVINTQERPDRATAWVSMNTLMNEIAVLEHEIQETVNTPEGPRQIKIVVLNPKGGCFFLNSDAFDLLKKLWNTHRDKNLTLAQARQVAFTDDFLNSVTETD